MVSLKKTDTIGAIATPPGIGSIGIIRISGPDAFAVLERLFRPHGDIDHTDFQSHKLVYGTFVDRNSLIIDEILAVFMRSPHTYTREDVVELHSHGNSLVLQAILSEVFAVGVRPAQPGEFTKRAFLAGRIDLTRAEAVIDLLEAKTDSGVHLAVAQMQGGLEERIDSVRAVLIGMLAEVEVAIDFPDDEVELLDSHRFTGKLEKGVLVPVRNLLELSDRGRIIREGVQVVIAGRPNVGKSSLLNGLLQEDRALVTSVAGTTRDTIEEMISVWGVAVHLIDTAGIREHKDLVEGLGIERARGKIAGADLALFLIDVASGITVQDRELYDTIRDKPHIVVLNKKDLIEEDELAVIVREFSDREVVAVSARNHDGIAELEDAIYHHITGGRDLKERMPCAPNLRHKAILGEVLEAGERLKQAFMGQISPDLLAVELQSALESLSDIVGLTTPDDVLDKIFSEFCIGK